MWETQFAAYTSQILFWFTVTITGTAKRNPPYRILTKSARQFRPQRHMTSI
jgi:hypothetical protein